MRIGRISHHEKKSSGIHGVSGDILGTEDKDVSIASLDSSIMLSSDVLYPMVEQYSNHLGSTDNFTQTTTSGNGTATPDSTNHEMDLSSGITIVGAADFETKTTIALHASKPVVVNMIIQNIQIGTDGSKYTLLGMQEDFSTPASQRITFDSANNGSWAVTTKDGVSYTATSISTLVNGDHITIVATTSKVMFFVNGVFITAHTTYIPTLAMHIGAAVGDITAPATVARNISVDMMSIKHYV